MDWFLKTFDLAARDLYIIPIAAIVFWFFYTVIKRSVFDPYLALLDAREAASSGAAADASAMLHDAAEIDQHTDAKIVEARIAFMREKLARTNKAKQETEAAIKQAEVEAQQKLQRGRAELLAKRQNLESQLQRDAEAMAKTIVSKVLTEPSAPQQQVH
jgi:F0F1-type ATP synthase membrane subunit b/b'